MTGPKTKSNGEIIPTGKGNPEGNLINLLQEMLPEIKRALPAHLTPDRIVRIATTAMRLNPDLTMCTQASFVGCVMQAAQLGLEVNTPLGHAYLIARKQRGLPDHMRNCTIIIGYQGKIELARRSKLVGPISAYAVREGDFFEYELGLDPNVTHRPSLLPDREDDSKHPITFAYAVAKMRDSNDRNFAVLSRAQIEKRRLRGASAYATTPWDTDYEAMALKSAAHALWPWLPKSAEMARAGALDTAADMGGSQLGAMEDVVTEALRNRGLVEDAELVQPAQLAQPAQPTDTTLEDQLRRSVQQGAGYKGAND